MVVMRLVLSAWKVEVQVAADWHKSNPTLTNFLGDEAGGVWSVGQAR